MSCRESAQRMPGPHMSGATLLRIDLALLIERAGAEERANAGREVRAYGEIGLESARHQPGEAVEIEAAPLAREPRVVAVPVLARERRELLAQPALVQSSYVGMEALAEQAEEIVEVERAHARELQLEERGLTRVGIDGNGSGAAPAGRSRAHCSPRW